MVKSLSYWLVLGAALALGSGKALAEPGSIGFSVAVSADGFLSPTLTRAEITSVRLESPAALAGVRVGDQIVRLEDCAIPGCPAGKARDLMNREVGQTLKLRVLRGDGSEQDLAIVVGPRPAK